MGEPGTQGSRDDAEAGADLEEPERARAYRRVLELVVELHTAVPGADDEIEALLLEAEHLGWSDVVRIATFAAAVAAEDDHPRRSSMLQRLLHQAEVDDAPAMIALALAMRSDHETSEEDPQMAFTADEDLTRASVVLESADELAVERVWAHNACAQAYCSRWLWEIADEHFSAALALAEESPASWAAAALPAIAYNRAKMRVSWPTAQRQVGDAHGLVERWRAWQAAMATVDALEMPAQWAAELEALGVLLSAIIGRDVSVTARAQLAGIVPGAHPRAWPAGWLSLAIALSEQGAGRLESAAPAAERAVSEIDPRGSPDTCDLALCVVAELEAAGRPSAMMRYARRQLSLRWSRRLATLGAAAGRIQAERMRREHDAITEQVQLDELTGLLNRRGFGRYLEGLGRRDVHTVALLAADLDHFKSVNDRYGHAVGDTVLVTVGRLLRAHVRQGDCAVRTGGDEFAIVLASVGLDVARRRAETLAEAVRRHSWDDLAPGLEISLSVGIAVGRPTESAGLIERADRTLYAAKSSGRDTVMWHLSGTRSDSADDRSPDFV
jgi:diguanylate cyclase (GGDEF)-like protein